jgi:hypothetical protein
MEDATSVASTQRCVKFVVWIARHNGALTSDGLTVASLLAAGKPLMVQRMVDRREAADGHTWTKATRHCPNEKRSGNVKPDLRGKKRQA